MSTAGYPPGAHFPGELRSWRLNAYDELRRQRPDLFENPVGAAYEIVFDPEAQAQVTREAAAWNRTAGIPEQYADIGVVYQDPFVTLVKDAVRFRSGRLGPYIRLLPTSATVTAGAAVFPVYQGNVVLLRHFRHASRAWLWEIPRGFGEAGEAADDTARREVREEIGAEAIRLVPLGPLRLEGGVSKDLPQLFWAEISQPRQLEAEEGIDEVRMLRLDELDHMVVNGEIDDAFTLAALAYARAHGLA